MLLALLNGVFYAIESLPDREILYDEFISQGITLEKMNVLYIFAISNIIGIGHVIS